MPVDDAGRAEIFQDLGGFPRALGIVRRDTDIERATRTDDIVQRAAGFFERRFRVEAMRIEDIDIVEAHALQALVTGRDEILAAAPFAIGTRPHVVTRLGRDDQLIAQT
jgi:hypothetical protein